MVFCLGCQRNKMLFESQSKADNFIKYNSEGILEENGKAPVRSYYCEFCFGYHVTSIPMSSQANEMDKRDKARREKVLIDAQPHEEFKKFHDSLSRLLENAKKNLKKGNIQGAEDALDVCELYLEDMNSMMKFSIKERAKLVSIRGRVEKQRKDVNVMKALLELAFDEQLAYISRPNLSKDEDVVRVRLAKILIERDITPTIQENYNLFGSGQIDDIAGNISFIKKILDVIAGVVSAKTVSEIRGEISKQEFQLKRISDGLKASHQANSAQGSQSSVTSPDADDTSTHQGDHEKKNYRYVNKSEYKATLFSLIENLESIKQSYESNDFDRCAELIEIGDAILADFQVEDDNTRLIRAHFDDWRTRLSWIEDGEAFNN